MKQVLFFLSLAIAMCSCESQSGQLIKQQQLIKIASQDSTQRDSLIEAAIHKIAETSPTTYQVKNSTEEDEQYHSISSPDAIYTIGDQTGIQTVAVVDNDELAIRIMRQLDFNHIRYSITKGKNNIWDIAYRNIIYVPNLSTNPNSSQ
jgi:hypothetical protein